MFGMSKRDKGKMLAGPPMQTALTGNELADQPANYNTALDWLLGLSEKDYQKMCKVVEIYRAANKDASKALGIKSQPVTALPEPDKLEAAISEVNHTEPDGDDALDSFVDDELNKAFLQDDSITPEPQRP